MQALNGPEFPTPVRNLSAVLHLGPDPVTGDVWLGLNPLLRFLCFLGRVVTGFQGRG